MLLSDTVGFIRKLPHHLVEAFKATLEELSYADLLLHVIDALHLVAGAGRWWSSSSWSWAEQTPRIDVFNKCDRFTGDILPHGADIVSISAKTGQGLDELLKKIGGRLDTGACRVVLRLPYDQAAWWTCSTGRRRWSGWKTTARPSRWRRCVPPSSWWPPEGLYRVGLDAPQGAWED